MPRKSPSVQYYLSSRYKVVNQCWEWQSSLNRQGYGDVHNTKWGKKLKLQTAHRMAYHCWVGKIPKNKVICHKCDNPKCINPKHLFMGTLKDNSQDMMRKGRHVVNHQALRRLDYRAIFKSKGRMTMRAAAKLNNCSAGSVCLIWNGKQRILD